MISAIGLSFLLQNVLLQVGGAEPRRLDPFVRGVVFLGPIALPLQYVAILALSAVLIVAMQLYLSRAWNGLALRASAEDMQTAALMGITTDRLATVTFGVGSALAAAAGVLVGSVFLIPPSMGTVAVVKAFVVAKRTGDEALASEIQALVRGRLSQHEYPRLVAFVEALPKTPAGKVNRKALRDQEQARREERT